jgi:hypothetical protein
LTLGIGFKDDKGNFRPTDRKDSGVSESSFNEKKGNFIQEPRNHIFNKASSPEKNATLNKMNHYIKGLNRRISNANQKQTNMDIKPDKKTREADKNLELGGQFISNSELPYASQEPPQASSDEVESFEQQQQEQPRQRPPKNVDEYALEIYQVY